MKILNWLKLFLFDYEFEQEGTRVCSETIDYFLGAIEYQRNLLCELLEELPPSVTRQLLGLQLLELDWHILYFGLYSDLSGGLNSVKSGNSISQLLRFIDRFLKYCQRWE